MRTLTRIIAVAVLAMLVVPASASAGPPPPAPVIVVDPSVALVDGQVVTVTGSGFAGGQYLEIFQCRAGAVDEFDCDPGNAFPFNADLTGGFVFDFQVDAFMYTQAGASDPVDCRTAPGACEIGVGNILEASDAVSAPISFDPDAPLRPPVAVTVSPSTGLSDGQTIQVSGANLTPREEAFAFQCAADDPVDANTVCAYGDLARGVPDADGSIVLPLVVRSVFTSPAGRTVDCGAPGSCVVTLSWGYSYLPDRSASAPITFAGVAPPPTAPPTAPPAEPVAAQPSFTG
ncbi:MAG TPA: neocarzinostatin apoprotein domain-containing protein [Acidimicrobiales bacterium]|nr:neocarzinostatin apoprotein domain-containing protein [Acidimicrobiales bacterium]